MTGALVLVVDDDEDIRDVLAMVLRAEGYRVATAVDGADAEQKVRGGEPPGLVLLDLMMPNVDGYAFLRRHLRGEHARVPVVVMSGHDAAQTERVPGAAAVLKKPFETDDLLRIVGRLATLGASTTSAAHP